MIYTIEGMSGYATVDDRSGLVRISVWSRANGPYISTDAHIPAALARLVGKQMIEMADASDAARAVREVAA